jgi:hypothetical protein
VSPGRKPLPSENIVRLATKPLRQGKLVPPQGNEVKLLRGLVQPESATLQRRSLSRANWRTQFRHLGQYRFCSPIISLRASRRFARCLAKSAGRTASSRLSLEKGRLQMPAQSLLLTRGRNAAPIARPSYDRLPGRVSSSSSSTSRSDREYRRYQRTAQRMSAGSVCRHLKIVGRVAISRSFHVVSRGPMEVATQPLSGLAHSPFGAIGLVPFGPQTGQHSSQ